MFTLFTPYNEIILKSMQIHKWKFFDEKNTQLYLIRDFL